MNNKPIQHDESGGNKNTPDDPLISIITPILNRVGYVEECIQSVLNQSYPNIEHIFIDGVSTDGTLEMLGDYKAKYPDRIKFMSEPDSGACDAWNKGFLVAKGQIFGWLGSDDTYPPDAVMTVVRFFNENPDAHLVFGDTNMINEAGRLVSRVYAEDFNLEKSITTACCMYTPSVFYKREVVEAVGPLDATINVCDFDFYLKAGRVFQFHRIEKVLANFRIHKGSVTGNKDSLYMYARENYLVARRHGATIFSPRGRNYILMTITHPIHPLLVAIYNSRLLKPILAPIFHAIIGSQGHQDDFDNSSKT